MPQTNISKAPSWQIFSGSGLKVLAMFAMLTDHIALHLLSQYEVFTKTLCQVLDQNITVVYLLRSVGRWAFPLYCFLLVEGFVHTRNRKKYGTNLLIFALVSEIPWNFVHTGEIWYDSQNVFFTLFLGYLGLCIIEMCKDRLVPQICGLVLLFLLAFCLGADYGYKGYALILCLYALRQHIAIRTVVGASLLSSPLRGGLSFIPMTMYNGQRGFIKGAIGKYACYAFYPVHLLLIGIIKYYFI